jgi:hypothetical protein
MTGFKISQCSASQPKVNLHPVDRFAASHKPWTIIFHPDESGTSAAPFDGLRTGFDKLRVNGGQEGCASRFIDCSGGPLLTVRAELLLAVHGEPVEPERQATGYQLSSSLQPSNPLNF